MESWDGFARAEPEIAAKGIALLDQRGDGEGMLATVAADGTPRYRSWRKRSVTVRITPRRADTSKWVEEQHSVRLRAQRSASAPKTKLSTYARAMGSHSACASSSAPEIKTPIVVLPV